MLAYDSVNVPDCRVYVLIIRVIIAISVTRHSHVSHVEREVRRYVVGMKFGRLGVLGSTWVDFRGHRHNEQEAVRSSSGAEE